MTLEVNKVSRSYGNREVVSGISFILQPGDLLGLVGPNGAGKSTTLKMITGMLAPTSGGITLGGVDLFSDPLLPRRMIGYVPEFISLYEYLTAEEYLDFVGEIKGIPQAERLKEAELLLDILDLLEERRSLVRTYSQGMRRKVALAAAMLGRPPILVLDEALNGLDPTTIARLKAHLGALTRQGTAVLLASHVLDVVERVCNRLVMIRSGRVAEQLSEADLARVREAEGGLEQWFLHQMSLGEIS